MQLTPEQKTAVNISLTEQSIVINACAGSGKSSTLREIVRAVNSLYPWKRILACMFNKAAQIDFQKKLNNAKADVRTTHSLAYHAVVWPDSRLQKKLKAGRITGRIIVNILNIEPYHVDKKTAEILQAYGCGTKGFSDSFIARAVYAIVLSFQKSSDLEINQTHADKTISKGIVKHQKFYKNFSSCLLKLARKMWFIMINPDSNFPITHDTYLKLWQLHRPILNYDLILVDEAQDTNPVMQDIFELYTHYRRGGQIIYVGDEKQSIYGFRGAVNAIERAEKSHIGIETLYLTKSFRFGQASAELANKILSLSARAFPIIKGSKSFNTVVNCHVDSTPFTVLCRTNAGAIFECLNAVKKGLQPHVVGNVKELSKLLGSAYALYCNNMFNISHPLIKQFSSWTEYIEASEISDDPEMKRIVKMINDEQDNIPEIVFMLERAGGIPESSADIIISTVHKAKGREWDNVKLCDDFRSLFKNDDSKKITVNEQELNLVYVAITRARHKLELNTTVQEILDRVEYGRATGIEYSEVSAPDSSGIVKSDVNIEPGIKEFNKWFNSLSEDKKDKIRAKVKTGQKENNKLKTLKNESTPDNDNMTFNPESWQDIIKKEGKDYRDRERIKRKISRWLNNFKNMSDLEQKVFLVSMQEQGYFNKNMTSAKQVLRLT